MPSPAILDTSRLRKMNRIIITCNNLPASESVGEFIEAKFSALFDLCDEVARIRVALSSHGGDGDETIFVSRVAVNINRADFAVVFRSTSSYAAVEGAFRKCRRELRYRSRAHVSVGPPSCGQADDNLAALAGRRSSCWTFL